MPDSLSSTEVIGGISVIIDGDTSKLKAAAGDAQQIAAKIEKLAPAVKIGAVMDSAKIVADVKALQGKIPELRIPVVVDTGPAMRQIADLRAQMQNMRLALPAGSTGGSSSTGWTMGGSRRTDYDFEGEVIGERPQLALPAPGGGGGGYFDTTGQNYNGGPAPDPGSAPIGWRQALTSRITGARGIRLLGGVLAAEGIGHTIEAGYDVSRALTATTIEGRDKAIQEGQQAIGGIPIVGGMIRDAGQFISSGGQVVNNLIHGRGFRTDASVAEDTLQSAAEEDKYTDKLAKRAEERGKARIAAQQATEQLQVENAGFGLSAADQKVIADKSDLVKFDRDNQKFKGIQEIAEQRQQLVIKQAHDQQIANAEFGYKDASSAITAGDYSIAGQAATLTMAGDVRGADRLRLRSRQQDSEQGLQNKIDYAKGQGNNDDAKRMENELKSLKQANIAELAEFDKQQAQEIASDKMMAAASEGEAKLRLSHDYYQADLAEFDANLQKKIDGEQDVQKKAILAREGAAQRSVIVQQQQEQIADTNSTLYASGTAALQSAAGDRFGAAWTNLLNEADIAIDKPSPETKDAVKKHYADLEQALYDQQADAGDAFGVSMAGRIVSAEYRGKGESKSAGLAQTIAGMEGQIISDPFDAADLANADIADLRADYKLSNRATRYGSAWNPMLEAKGGPGGDAGKDQTDYISLLNKALEYLSSIAKQNGQAVVSN